jgi:hypothetical protein
MYVDIKRAILDWWLFDTITHAQAHAHTYTHTHMRVCARARMHTLVSTVTSSLPLIGSHLQKQIFHFPLGSQSVPKLTHQLPSATTHNDWTESVR